ncbi:hypothetical protein [Metaprevotella massiliensis]|uniref:hypothetical protein n=1 Tax=Metaprevotella massiliensis TaxID=1870999 RepID=UPI0015E1AF87|nr:hypothetical protein [Metaprevotella massiliensis]
MLQKNGIYYVFFSLQERDAPFATWFVVNQNVNTASLVSKYGEFGRQIRRVWSANTASLLYCRHQSANRFTVKQYARSHHSGSPYL